MNWHQLMEKALAELKENGAAAAEPYLLKALDLVADNSEFRAITLFNLGLVAYDLKRPKECETCFLKALELIQEKLPKQNELFGIFLKTLIEFYEKENRLSEAKKYYLLEIDHTRQMYGARHPYVANITGELIDLLIKAADWAEAEKYLVRALDVMSAAKGQDHLSNVKFHRKLSHCYEKLNRPQDAAYHAGRAEALELRGGLRQGKQESKQEKLDTDTVEQSLD